jgi:hypothetical protein
MKLHFGCGGSILTPILMGLNTPLKKHVTVRGILRKASDVIEYPNSIIKEVTLESLQGNTRVVCKLWGEKATQPLPSTENIVTVKSVEVAAYKD